MISERLKLARGKADLSLRDLAEKLDGLVTAQALGKYERGEMMPGADVLQALARALNVSLPFLVETEDLGVTEADFRKDVKTSAKDEARVKSEVLFWASGYIQIESILDLKSAHWEQPFHKRKIKSLSDAETVAGDLRKEWKLGEDDPIRNVTELLEEKGLKVLATSLPESVSGFTCMVSRKNNHAPVRVIVVNKSHSLERRRFSLLHELGHCLIDAELLGKQEERAMHRFSAAFMAPKHHVFQEVGRHRNSLSYIELVQLKHLYRMSAVALVYRLADLEIISQSTLTRFFATVGRNWRTVEPDPIEQEGCGPLELPQRFERLVYRALSEDLIGYSKASELLTVPIHEVKQKLRGGRDGEADTHL